MAGLLARDSSSGRLPNLLASDFVALCHRLQRRVRGGFVPIPYQGAIFVGSSSATQRTPCTPRRLNPRRLDIILDLKSGVHPSSLSSPYGRRDPVFNFAKLCEYVMQFLSGYLKPVKK